MYPFIRFALEMRRCRALGPVDLDEVHICQVRAMPWDIDLFLDLNNGRVLTLFDLGRMGFFQRLGTVEMMRKNNWYGTVAGSVIRYRKRITMFQRLELRTKLLGWDEKFTYIDHQFWRGDDCAAHAVIRTALTTGKGIVPTKDIQSAMGIDVAPKPLPDWVQAWSNAEAMRPWPPN